jgi:hypothetical protein
LGGRRGRGNCDGDGQAAVVARAGGGGAACLGRQVLPPAIGAIALLGAWLVTRLPGRAWLAGLTSTAVITALFGLGVWAFYAMYAAIDVPLRG